MGTTLKVEVADAGGASWRARYLYVNGSKVAHIGVTPNGGTKPQLFGSVAGREFRLPLPTVRWKYPCSPLRMAAYKVVHQFWHNMDGRYGWGSEYRRKAKEEERGQVQS